MSAAQVLLFLMPTTHSTGLRKKPSIVSNCNAAVRH